MGAVKVFIFWFLIWRIDEVSSKIYVYYADSSEAFLDESAECDYVCIFVERSDDVEDFRTFYDSGHNVGINKVSIPYGFPLQLRCINTKDSNATKLVITQNDVELQAESREENSITCDIGKPGLFKSEYVCTDLETNCAKSVIVSVTPVVSVTSVNLESVGNLQTNYIIKYGDSMTVSCFGPPDAKIAITKDGEKLQTAKEGNTLKWFDIKPDLQVSEYACIDADTNTSSSLSIKVEPLIYVQIKNETIKRDYYHSYTLQAMYRLSYGSSIEVFCVGQWAVKLFTFEGIYKEISTVQVNETTVKAFVTNLKIGESVIACIDSEVREHMSTVSFMITPRLNVLSPEIRFVEEQYYMKYGDPLEIICSGPDSGQLMIINNSGLESDELNYTIMNETSIRLLVNNTNGDMSFICTAVKTETDSKKYVQIYALPLALGFRCESQELLYLNCTWTTPWNNVDYTLTYEDNEVSVLACTKSKPWAGKLRFFCIWDYNSNIKEFNFLMQSCSKLLGCFNQSFLIDHASILRIEPPERLYVFHGSPRSVVINWARIEISCAGKVFRSYTGDFDYKVAYSYSGIQPMEVNSSLVHCKYAKSYIQLPLPCAGQFYKVQIYHKLKKAVGEQFWSNPSTITFHSDFGTDDSVADSTCNLEPKKTKEVMMYLLHKLNNDVRLEMGKIRNKVKLLKEKLAKIPAELRQKAQLKYLKNSN